MAGYDDDTENHLAGIQKSFTILIDLKEKFGPSFDWVPHTTMLIDEPENIYKALPMVVKEFSSFHGKVTCLHLYEFWPTRHILTVNLR